MAETMVESQGMETDVFSYKRRLENEHKGERNVRACCTPMVLVAGFSKTLGAKIAAVPSPRNLTSSSPPSNATPKTEPSHR